MKALLAALAVVTVSACSLYSEGDGVPSPGSDHEIAPGLEVSGVVECAPTREVDPCPPWWLMCQPGQLRQSECQTACTTGERTCAGYNVGECFNDCVAYRYEAYCPGL